MHLGKNDCINEHTEDADTLSSIAPTILSVCSSQFETAETEVWTSVVYPVRYAPITIRATVCSEGQA